VDQRLHEEVQEALADMQRYLADQIPPLTASDAIETLIHQPPELLIRQIHSWAVEQSRLQSASMCDFLFHALRKVYLFGSLRLIDKAVIDAYLNRLAPLALQACPVEERDLLRSHLSAMAQSRSVSSAAVTMLRGPGEESAAAAAPLDPGRGENVVARSARRLSLVIERLAGILPGRPATAPGTAPAAPAFAALPQQTPAAQLLTMAAASSTSEQELDSYIETLRPWTGNAERDSLFRLLAGSVPGWEISAPPETKVKPAASLEAMHKIISLTRSPLESTKRFRELVMAAVEQFNSGALGAALSMLELADVVIAEKKLDPSSVERIRADAVEAISSEQLKRYGENKSRHSALRQVLASFPPLRKENLLQQLRGEERPERRRSLLGLLEAYGSEGRDAALDELEIELARPTQEIDTYYLRNVIYLLHRIQRDPDAPVEREFEHLARSSARGQSIYVIKEAVIPLGHIRTDAAVKLLTTRLAEFEAMLLRSDTSIYPMDEMQKLLDRITAALGRIGTPAALLTVARHGMKPNPLLGDTRGRLSALSAHDLSFDEQTVNLLVRTVRDDLPGKLLGKLLPKRQPPPIKLIEALSSTRSEIVDELLAEVAEKFPEHDVGRTAAAALVAREAAASPAAADGSLATLTGDLQFFGLPSLMQSLAETQATGIVTLTTRQGQTVGKMLFLGGKFVDALASHLKGTDALYQLLERPVTGSFSFVPQPPVAVRSRNTPVEVMSLLFEGIRRHDELKQAALVAPDDVSLRPGSTKPTPAPEESDPAIVREVWVKASSGKKVAEWEGEISTDAYRVRRLVAHWLEEGALQRVD
jgi:hypothetical protein